MFIPLSEKDKEKTAFSVPNGKFEFNVTPFGLFYAGASYQRMIEMCLAGLPVNRVLAYMDDVIIFTESFTDHFSAIEDVFKRFRAMGVSLKASKCHFVKMQEFLGFHLSSNGIQPQKDLCRVVPALE